jgi:hypothetical protein
MAQRRFGPTLGAGVVVVEQEAEKLLEPASLGVTAYVGILERGDVGKLISTFSKRSADARIGGRIEESQVPDAVADFWQHSNGAGEVHLVRVTDGTERASEFVLWSREVNPIPVAKIKAHNGGRWGGRLQALAGVWNLGGDLTETTLTTGKAFLTDEWRGARLYLKDVPSKSYEVVSNTSAGVITVRSDSKMLTDYGAGTDKNYHLVLERDTAREVTFEIGDGEIDPANEFSLTVFVNGNLAQRFPDLNPDPAHARYFASLINDDSSNDLVLVEDLLAPATPSAARRPANEYGEVEAVTALSLTRKLAALKVVTSPTGANPTLTMGTTTDAMKFRDRLTITMTSATVFTVSSLIAGTLVATGTVGALYTPASPLVPPFTLTNGATVLASGDVMEIDYFPLRPGELVGATLYPNYGDSPLKGFRISANDHKSITVLSGDLSAASAIAKSFMVAWRQPLGGTGRTGGYDGVAAIADAHYTAVLDPSTSPLKKLIGQNKGLVKLACPGKTSTAVQKAGLAFAEAMNWQFREEIPSNTVTEEAALTYVNQTIGRNDMGVVSFPSYGYVDNPTKPGQLKLQTLTGMIHGREALMAKNYDGYHKAAAGVEVTLPRVLKLPATELNEEVLNPAGIGIVKTNKGNAILWGDRTISVDPAWKWKHQRELMSHYENRIRESFDWVVFAINDPATQGQLLTALRVMFRPEFTKRAVRGKTFDDAVQIKVDDDINTDDTRAAGDLHAEISLRLADTVERFVVRVGKAGIFESQT